MAIDHALGPAGGAGRVAQPERRLLGDVARRVAIRLAADQLFVADQVGQARTRHVAENHDVLDLRERRCEVLERGDLIRVDEDRAVVGVLDDVGEIFERQPDVERVEHPPGARHREVALEVAVVVPRQGGDPLPGRDAERVERVHQLLGAPGELGVGVAMNAARDLADDLGMGEMDSRVLKHQPRIELHRHHRQYLWGS
jgi:hypothetical protein